MKIIIRTDASNYLGSGHVMRCLTLAGALKQSGADVTFLCRELPGNLIPKIILHGFSVISFPPLMECSFSAETESLVWSEHSQDNDAADYINMLKSNKEKLDWLIVDHYCLDSTWEDKIRPFVHKIMVIDDLANRVHDCDLILDQNLYDDASERYKNLISSSCSKLLGPKYTLLRPEFHVRRESSKKMQHNISRILVFFGGTDSDDHTNKTLSALIHAGIESIFIDVVVGPNYENFDMLMSIYGHISNINIYRDIDNMEDLMSAADIAIGAGGTTTWERCCVGLPTLAWPIADNQKLLLEHVSRYGAVYCPDLESITSRDDLSKVIYSFVHSRDIRSWIRTKGMELVDGLGTSRVINNLLSQSVSLREAQLSDAEDIFRWRTLPDVINVSSVSRPFTLEEHLTWFNNVLNDSKRLLLIASIDNKSVGVIRYDIQENEAIVSIYLSPYEQGKGYASQVLEQGQQWLMKNYPSIHFLIAKIMENNSRSIKLFSLAGFNESYRCYMKGLY